MNQDNDIVDPLFGAIPAEVPLENAPLVRVIAQVRFPEILTVEQSDFVAPFQLAITDAYPVLRREQAQIVTLGATPQARSQTAWRFSDLDGTWRLSLTSEFLSLETTQYKNRKDFFDRFRVAIQALAAHIRPKQLDRVGVRYINRITGNALEKISLFVRNEVSGVLGTKLSEHTEHSLSENLFNLDKVMLLARWGRVPSGATTDTTAIEPIQESSWLLDLDLFSTLSTPFDVDAVIKDAEQFAERSYAFFRWTVTNEFLQHYGGKP